MTVCKLGLKPKNTSRALEVLRTIAQSQFDAIDVYSLAGDMFNIDAGLNDVRAKLDSTTGLITFVCRNDVDVLKTEKKIAAFAQNCAHLCSEVVLKKSP